MEPTKHFGVYAVWQQEARIVLVRKARGPYEGLLDLPGGSPECGESVVATLRRELREECGVELIRVLDSVAFEFHVDRDSSGQLIDFTHAGLVSRVEVAGPVLQDIAAEDVRGVVLATVGDTPMFSPPVLEALRCFPATLATRTSGT